MTAEIWKPVPEFEGLYEVSNLGRVRSLDREKHAGNGTYYTLEGRVLRTRLDKDGYELVDFRESGLRKTGKVHRIVAEVFIREPSLNEEIHHVNAVRNDNRVGNLRWVSHAENIRDSYKRRVGPSRKPVIAESTTKGASLWFPSVLSVVKHGFHRSGVQECLSGRSKQSLGYVWGYA